MRQKQHQPFVILIFLFGIVLTGCGAPLKYTYMPSNKDRVHLREQLPAIYIAPIEDKRSDIKDVKNIGTLQSTVLNMWGKKLHLSDDPSFIIREGLIREFIASGFNVRDSATENAEYILQGTLLRFRLDIASKDNIDIALRLLVIRARDKKILRSKVVKVSDSIYAGVSGDSRKSIAKYISKSLEIIFKKIVKDTERVISVRALRQGTVKSSHNKENADYKEKSSLAGTLSIVTTPSRTKIYLNGIYYGLSPMRLLLKPGIYKLLIKKDGFFEYREKIAVDRGRKTEVEEMLHKK